MLNHLQRLILAFWQWLTSPIDNPYIALGLALVGVIGLLLLLWWLAPVLAQLQEAAP